jgi:hypothetical protein
MEWALGIAIHRSNTAELWARRLEALLAES